LQLKFKIEFKRSSYADMQLQPLRRGKYISYTVFLLEISPCSQKEPTWDLIQDVIKGKYKIRTLSFYSLRTALLRLSERVYLEDIKELCHTQGLNLLISPAAQNERFDTLVTFTYYNDQKEEIPKICQQLFRQTGDSRIRPGHITSPSVDSEQPHSDSKYNSREQVQVSFFEENTSRISTCTSHAGPLSPDIKNVEDTLLHSQEILVRNKPWQQYLDTEESFKEEEEGSQPSKKVRANDKEALSPTVQPSEYIKPGINSTNRTQPCKTKTSIATQSEFDLNKIVEQCYYSQKVNGYFLKLIEGYNNSSLTFIKSIPPFQFQLIKEGPLIKHFLSNDTTKKNRIAINSNLLDLNKVLNRFNDSQRLNGQFLDLIESFIDSSQSFLKSIPPSIFQFMKEGQFH
jgi:hypothetical protein